MGDFWGIYWFFGAVVAAVVAMGRGKSPWLYFVLALVLSPVLAFVLIFGLPAASPDSKTHRICPACRSHVVRAASKCRHCGSDMPPLEL